MQRWPAVALPPWQCSEEAWNVVTEPEVAGGRGGRKGLETGESVTW